MVNYRPCQGHTEKNLDTSEQYFCLPPSVARARARARARAKGVRARARAREAVNKKYIVQRCCGETVTLT